VVQAEVHERRREEWRVSNRHRLLRLEHAAQQREAIIARVDIDPRLALLEKLEQQAARIAALDGAEYWPDQESAAARMCRAALDVGRVGTDAFRRELMRLFAAYVETFRQEWPGPR
jgi:hypothetical protein